MVEAGTETVSKAYIAVLMGKMPKLKYYSSKDISNGSLAGQLSREATVAKPRFGSAIVVPPATIVGRLRVKCFSDALRAFGS